MKKILLMLALVTFMFAGTASANNAALVIKDGFCGLLDGNGGFAVAENAQTVATKSVNGKAMLKCQTDVEPPVSGQAVHYDYASTGIMCGMITIDGFIATENWRETVSAEGKATFICRAE